MGARQQASKWGPSVLIGIISAFLTVTGMVVAGGREYVDKVVYSHPIIREMQRDMGTVKSDVQWIRGFLQKNGHDERGQ